jgi:hypothetical protein
VSGAPQIVISTAISPGAASAVSWNVGPLVAVNTTAATTTAFAFSTAMAPSVGVPIAAAVRITLKDDSLFRLQLQDS